jgi:hypothetical protein
VHAGATTARKTKEESMMNRFATGLVLLGMTLPLTACGGGGDDDSGGNTKTSPWSGKTYLLSLSKRDWTMPKGIGQELLGVAPAFIFKVTGTGDNLTATMATGPGTYPDPVDATNAPLPVTPAQAMQDLCGPTVDIPFSASGHPKMTLGPQQVRMFVKNNNNPMSPLQITADVYDLKFTDILPNGNTPSTTGVLEAKMDFRQLYALFGSLGNTRTPESVCTALVGSYPDGMCTACPDGQPFCLSVKAEQIGAEEAPNLTVTEVSEQTRPATCADSPAPMPAQ